MHEYDVNVIKISAVIALTVFTMVKNDTIRDIVLNYTAMAAIAALKGIVAADRYVLRVVVWFFTWLFDYAKYCQPRPLAVLFRFTLLTVIMTNVFMLVVVYRLFNMY